MEKEKEPVLKDILNTLNSVQNDCEISRKKIEHLNFHLKEFPSPEQLNNFQDRQKVSVNRMETNVGRLESAIKSLPQQIKMDIHHRFKMGTKVIAIILFVSILFGAIGIGMWSYAWQENKRLKANDYKYRYMHFIEPSVIWHTDTLFLHNKESFENMVEKMEAYKMALEEAEKKAMKEESDAKKARKKVKQLREKSK